MFGLRVKSPRSLLIKLLIVFIPVYSVAYVTQSMVYVLPTIAVFFLFGASMQIDAEAGNGPTAEKDGDSDGDGDGDSS